MSWYNTVGDTTQLYYSLNDGYNWNEPILLAQSDNWFVNWADFSSVIGYNGKAIAAHWLQKIIGRHLFLRCEIINLGFKF